MTHVFFISVCVITIFISIKSGISVDTTRYEMMNFI